MASRLAPTRPSDALVSVLVATVAVGVSVAIVQFVQGPVALGVVLVVSTVWFVTPVVVGVRMVSARRRSRRGLPSGLTLVGVGAALVGTANLALLGLVRVFEGRDALMWNIDWRYHLVHAQTIARFADLGTALDYLGADVRYHVGPAWIAGAFEHFTGWGIDAVSFLGIPAMTGVVTFTAGAYLCTRLGTSDRVAAFAAGILLVLPTIFFNGLELFELPYLRNKAAFQFSARFILNGQLAWAVGLAGVALLASRRRGPMIVGAIGIATVPVVKPQYFPGFLLVAVVVGVVQILGDQARRDAARRFLPAIAVVTIGGMAMFVAESGGDSPVGAPVLRWWNTGLPVREYVGLPLVLLVLCGITWVASSSARTDPMIRLALGLGAAAAAVVLALSVVQFPSLPESVLHNQEFGLALVRSTHQWDIGQANLPIVLIGTLCGIAGLATVALRHEHWGARALVVAGCVTALVAMPLMVTLVLHPASRDAQEAAEDDGLRRVLAQVPTDGTVLVASDLADPADGYLRPLSALLLNAYGGHQFLLSNVAYSSNYDRPGALHRLESMQRFFGSDGWSPWHTRFVRRYGVTHVLVDERCAPNWSTWPDQLERIASSGSWTVARVRPSVLHGPSETQAGSSGTEAWRPLRQTHGQSPCLSGT